MMLKIECKDCGLDYTNFGVDLVLADQHWLKIADKYDILCPTCICKRADKKGYVSLLAWLTKK